MMLPLLVVAALLGSGLGLSLGTSKKLPITVDSAYIVQLKVDSSLTKRSIDDLAEHHAFHKRAVDMNVDYSVRRQFTNSNLFYGISIDVKGNDTDKVLQAKLKAIEGVEAVFPVLEFTRFENRPRTTGTPYVDRRSESTPLVCNSNNCLRALRGNSVSAASFCHTYTTSVNDNPSAIPTFMANCDGSPSAVSSACSCLVASSTPTPTTAPTPLVCNSNNCLRALRGNFVSAVSFCDTYTTSVNTNPSAIPTFMANCNGSPSAVSSACSCLVSSSTSSPSSTPTSFSTSVRVSTTSSQSQSASSASSSSSLSSSTDPLRPPKVTGTSDVLSALEMSGVDKLHALGIKGKGMKIGVIDTGVDYRHPSLGGGFGPGFKIAGGYAYRNDAGQAVSSADPLTTCLEAGHGTHVAGIIGMEDPDDVGFGLVGVAPEAEIYMYRVFGCTGNGQTDDILAALSQAHADGVDVVSLSLGSITYWQTADPFQTMTSALVSEGVAVIAAAGNDGALGLFNPSSPGLGADVISVGSVENTQFPTVYTALDSEGLELSYASVWPLPLSEGRNVYVLGGTGCDESEWITASNTVTNSNDTIIIFSNVDTDSQCDFSDINSFWIKYGFQYIMAYTSSNSNPYSQQYILQEQDDNSTRYTDLLPTDGASVIANYAKAGGYPNYQIIFSNNTVTSSEMSTGGMISYYSSFGPSWDDISQLKPQLSAPGGSILSTWPLGFNAGYAVLRGTSMATPFVAASYALVKSQLDLGVQQIRELLQSTSSPVVSAYYPDLLATAVQQGAGLINPYNAIKASTTVSPTEFSIGDTDDFVGNMLGFELVNGHSQSVTYKVTHNGAAMMEYSPFGIHPFLAQDPLWNTQPEYAVYAELEFINQNSVTVPAGFTGNFWFTITPPTDIDEAKIPVISGFIVITSSVGEEFTIPYAGLPYSRYNASYIDLSNHTLSDTVSVPWPVMWEYDPRFDNFTYYNGSGIMIIDKAPVIWYDYEVGPLINCLQPTGNLRVELLAANTTFKPTHYGYDPTVEWDYIPVTEPYRNDMEDGITPTYGVIGGVNPSMPIEVLIDWGDCTVIVNNDDYEDEGGVAPTNPGDYRILISALRWRGNVTDLSDWESWLSPIIRVIDT